MKSICDICRFYPCTDDGKKMRVSCPRFDARPTSVPVVTNYDRIVSKTPEELADWIAVILTYHGAIFSRSMWDCDKDCPLYKCCNDQPSDNIEDWLRQEVDT